MSKTKSVCLTGIGIALYVVLSMLIKIPVIGHISLDLGYIVLAIYCYFYGEISGAIVGACGCFLVSLLGSGWIGIGWPLGNLFIGAVCGRTYKMKKWDILFHILFTIVAVFIGIGLIKTIIECAMYSIPFEVKFVKDCVAFIMDAITMCIGLLIANNIKKIRGNPN